MGHQTFADIEPIVTGHRARDRHVDEAERSERHSPNRIRADIDDRGNACRGTLSKDRFVAHRRNIRECATAVEPEPLGKHGRENVPRDVGDMVNFVSMRSPLRLVSSARNRARYSEFRFIGTRGGVSGTLAA